MTIHVYMYIFSSIVSKRIGAWVQPGFRVKDFNKEKGSDDSQTVEGDSVFFANHLLL